jgi:transcriptional regulator with XRE-family HTH domain
VLDVGGQDWAAIRRLRRSEGLSISQIAQVAALARNTVKAALASEGPPAYRREPIGSLVDEFEARARELLAVYPSIPRRSA